jgi:hypothetical protein
MGLAVVAMATLSQPVPALRIAFFPPTQRALQSEVVVIGKVISIEPQPVDLTPAPGAAERVTHKVAVVKIQENLTGADNLTHLKIAFVPPAAPPVVDPPEAVPPAPIRRPPIGRGLPLPNLREGEQYLFFLVKHPDGPYYMMPGMYPPIAIAKDDEGANKELEQVKKITTALSNPLAGLKSDKPEVRVQTAAALILKFRATPLFAQQVEQVPIDAELNRLILQALAEADWSQKPDQEPTPLQPVQAFYALGLSPNDGWNPPKVVPPPPGQPPVDFNKLLHKSFVEWLQGPGKEYRIKKFVAKK